MSHTLKIERDGPITTLILNRPEHRNAVNPALADALREALEAFEEDPAAKVAVLTGAGGCFCAGADLKALSRGESLRIQEEGPGPMGPSRMMLNKPLVAGIAGFAVAGGLELALLADLRVVEEDATLGVFCRRFGVPLIDGGTVRLPRLIGLSRALDLILTGRPVSAEEALSMGLANRVVAKGSARAEAESLARVIAAHPQDCMRNDRLSAYEQVGMSLEDAIRNEFRHGMRSLASPEMIEGVMRFATGAGRHGSFDE